MNKKLPQRPPLARLVARLIARLVSLPALAAVVVVSAILAVGTYAQEGPKQCTLDRAKKKEAVRDIQAFFASHPPTLSNASFTFRVASRGVETEKKIEQIIAREKECCSELTYEVERHEKHIEVTVRGDVDEIERTRTLLFSHKSAAKR